MLNESEIRRVFRIVETTRHAERNRLCFVLSIYSGLRVGEIAALTIADVATQNGDVRREIKLGAHQTKGSNGRTVILSERVRREIASFLESQPSRHGDAPLIASHETVERSAMSRCRCYSRNSTSLQVFARVLIQGAELSRRA